LVSSLFRRSKRGIMAPTLLVPSTGAMCALRGCSNQTTQPCAYRDRRGRSCHAAFCPAHNARFSGISYCRRHAGTVQAIGERAADRNGLPDLNDRAPSLVNWIARDLDQPIRWLLGRTVRGGERVLIDESVHRVHDHSRRARWERSWRIVDHTGLVLKVAVHITEDNDSLVHVRVGSEKVADAVPPWIVRRRDGQEVEAAIDISQRQRFYQCFEENIAAAITASRGPREPRRTHPTLKTTSEQSDTMTAYQELGSS
jgi:hypothetical protein